MLKFEPGGAKCIAEALRHNTRILDIQLFGNFIRDKGFKWIAEAIKHNSFLLGMNLACNQIGDTGVQFLAKGLEMNQSILSVDLTQNPEIGLDCKGLESVAEALEINKSLETFICDRICISRN
jgi:hypothetical protein